MTRVVLVDDNESILNALREYLTLHQGIEVAGTTNSARNAIDLIEYLQPDLVITDLNMPEISGLELTRQLRQLHPHLSIIVLTGTETPQHRKQALDAGADAFLVKMSALTSLVTTIQELGAPQLH